MKEKQGGIVHGEQQLKKTWEEEVLVGSKCKLTV